MHENIVPKTAETPEDMLYLGTLHVKGAHGVEHDPIKGLALIDQGLAILGEDPDLNPAYLVEVGTVLTFAGRELSELRWLRTGIKLLEKFLTTDPAVLRKVEQNAGAADSTYKDVEVFLNLARAELAKLLDA